MGGSAARPMPQPWVVGRRRTGPEGRSCQEEEKERRRQEVEGRREVDEGNNTNASPTLG
jgi:hypothetical protein